MSTSYEEELGEQLHATTPTGMPASTRPPSSAPVSVWSGAAAGALRSSPPSP